MVKKIKPYIIVIVVICVVYALLPLFIVSYYEGRVDFVANRGATDVSSCKVIEYGYHGCGGPAWYLIYSSETTDEEKLTKLVERYNEADEEFNSALSTLFGGLAYTCDSSIKPKLLLENGKCVGTFGVPTVGGPSDQRFEKLAR